MSFRRVQSIQERSANGGAAAAAGANAYEAAAAVSDSVLPSSCLPDSGLEVTLDAAQVVPLSWMKMSAARFKPNGGSGGGGGGGVGGRMQVFWRKPLFHFLLCFFIGFGIGLMPLSSSNSSSSSGTIQHPVNHVSASSSSSRDAFKSVQGTSKRVAIEQNSSDASLLDLRSHAPSEKLLLVVTPTYSRPFQAMYLTRLSQTLRLVPPPLLWIVIETPGQSLETAELLRKTGVMYRHIGCDKNMTNLKDRGTQQRNVALSHIERHQLDGIVYFADDDNFYSLQLFQQLRRIKRFGTWPVAMLAHGKSKTILEGPVCEGSNVIGWHTNEKSKRLRRFHVDMSGFGFNSTILWDPKRWQRPTSDPIRQLDTVKEGFQETTFIEQLVADESQMEGLPSGCSKIMVWHLHLEAQSLSYPSGWKMDKYLEPIIHL